MFIGKVLSSDFQIDLKFRLKIFSNLNGVGGSVTEKVAPHFATFLDLKVGHLDLETIIANTYFVFMNRYKTFN